MSPPLIIALVLFAVAACAWFFGLYGSSNQVRSRAQTAMSYLTAGLTSSAFLVAIGGDMVYRQSSPWPREVIELQGFTVKISDAVEQFAADEDEAMAFQIVDEIEHLQVSLNDFHAELDPTESPDQVRFMESFLATSNALQSAVDQWMRATLEEAEDNCRIYSEFKQECRDTFGAGNLMAVIHFIALARRGADYDTSGENPERTCLVGPN